MKPSSLTAFRTIQMPSEPPARSSVASKALANVLRGEDELPQRQCGLGGRLFHLRVNDLTSYAFGWLPSRRMLARLAHLDRPPPQGRHRRLGRADALRRVLRIAGLEALVPELLDPRLLGVRGEPADAADVRHRRAGAARRRLPHRRATSRRRPASRRRSTTAAAVNPGSRVSSYFSTGSRAYVSKDGHTTFAEIYPPGTPNFSSDDAHQADARGAQGGDARRRDRRPDRPRRARGRVVGRRQGAERAHRGADRRRSARSSSSSSSSARCRRC